MPDLLASNTAPYLIGATGGSGTRALRSLLVSSGVFMGERVRESGDTHDFVPLLLENINPVLDVTRGLDYDPADLPAPLRDKILGEYRARIADHLADKPADAIGWGWKNPTTMYLLPLVHEIYPDLRFLHLLRDGRDMALSRNQNQHRKHYAHLFGEEPSGDVRLESIRLWARANTGAEAWATRHLGDRYLKVRFEDLCADPVTELGRVFSWAGVDTDPAAHADVIRPPDSIGRWRDLDADTVARMHEIAGAELTHFGYAVD